jgi:hypothetical protein
VGDKFFQQKDGMATGGSLSLIVNIVTEHFAKMALDPTQHKPSLWDAILVIWPQGPETLLFL